LCGDRRRHHRSPTSAKKPAGQDPEAQQRSELDTVPLCLCEKASPFWIILLLVEGDLVQGMQRQGLPQKALTNVRFRG
jgi:hypothetical protein